MEKLVKVVEQLRQVYKGKRVFLTGHTGFKGSWLLKMLQLLGADVKGYALMPKTPDDLYCLLNGDSICHSVIADLREREKLVSEITAYQPHFVFHLAAQPLVRLSYAIPSETFEVNAIGTANVLDGIRQLDGPCTGIMITTDKVYHNNEWLYPYRESDRLGGYDPYSASKACAELVISSYRNSFFNPASYDTHKKGVAVARAGNVIGGGDWSPDRLLPDIARALGNHKELVVRNPASIRPWQHVLEPLAGYLMLGAALFQSPEEFSGAYNFGPYADDALSVGAMVKLAIEKWGSGSYKVENNTQQLHEAGLLKLDISKATAKLNWKPKLNAEAAIRLTIDWYKSFNADRNEINRLTDEQIQTYLN